MTGITIPYDMENNTHREEEFNTFGGKSQNHQLAKMFGFYSMKNK